MYVTVNTKGKKIACYPDAQSAVDQVNDKLAEFVYPVNGLMLYLMTRDDLAYYDALRVWQKASIRVAHNYAPMDVLREVCGTDDPSFITDIIPKSKKDKALFSCFNSN